MDMRITVSNLAVARFLQDCVTHGLQELSEATWDKIRLAKRIEDVHQLQAETDEICDGVGGVINRLGIIVDELERLEARAALVSSEVIDAVPAGPLHYSS